MRYFKQHKKCTDAQVVASNLLKSLLLLIRKRPKVRTAPDSIMLVTDSIIPANVLSPGHKKDGI